VCFRLSRPRRAFFELCVSERQREEIWDRERPRETYLRTAGNLKTDLDPAYALAPSTIHRQDARACASLLAVLVREFRAWLTGEGGSRVIVPFRGNRQTVSVKKCSWKGVAIFFGQWRVCENTRFRASIRYVLVREFRASGRAP